MELPQPPQDQDLRNIIDKLAQFVARNGPEFEKMTKNKQKKQSKIQLPVRRRILQLLPVQSDHGASNSKAIGRWPGGTGSRRGLYGTEQAICNAPTGRRDASSAGPRGVDGGGARAPAVAGG